MYYVYILQCSNGTLYTGYSEDVAERVRVHKSGKVKSTSYRLPIKLIHYEAFTSKKDAKARETFLKSGYGREQIQCFMKDTLSK